MSFGADIELFGVEAIDQTREIIKIATVKLFSAIILDTPVSTGRARSNWFTALNQPSVNITKSRDLSGTKAITRMVNKLRGFDFEVIHLTNNLPYAELLENGGYPDPVKYGTYLGAGKGFDKKSSGGYSRQAPSGMVRKNTNRLKTLVDEAAKGVS